MDRFVLQLQTSINALKESLRYHESSGYAHSALFNRVYEYLRKLETRLDNLQPQLYGDPGNYLHRLNQVEQDIRELRQIVETNRQMCDGNVTAVLDFVDAHYQRKGRLSDATNNHS